jgi:predicted nucleotidyltransferase
MNNLNQITSKLKDLKPVLQQDYGVEEIALFGSFAKKTQLINSDLDILIEFKPGYNTFDNFMNLKLNLEDIFNRKIDLGIKKNIRKEFKAQILEEAIYV